MAKPASNFDDNRIHVKRQWCKGCGICTTLCENRVLLIDNRGKAVVVNPNACTGCGRCETHCPDLAISVDQPNKNNKIPVYACQAAKQSPGHGESARA
ncbi:2-oxoglutarate ferredoxin oxidoreductase subunit delta [Desulfotomaculum arcticum]|uniref:2-oxoglutarate ferredoxin oxidoreductase subunit delta n=1 Tax=Desulfotruncus arcticus DSM 17038 TaxID=1121424 RepID=A0A1I2Y0E2_9FIRM|nr:4Fe-4S dicluster domain-containing protein [Desulfotruncus arcticus]SFH19210.1 2-oxoglutarate ferredoxin oxidoreductase subunit delta [Desulfotomaculum arcticum] [Desulfotruncus arcticus DSM 17038]